MFGVQVEEVSVLVHFFCLKANHSWMFQVLLKWFEEREDQEL